MTSSATFAAISNIVMTTNAKTFHRRLTNSMVLYAIKRESRDHSTCCYVKRNNTKPWWACMLWLDGSTTRKFYKNLLLDYRKWMRKLASSVGAWCCCWWSKEPIIVQTNACVNVRNLQTKLDDVMISSYNDADSMLSVLIESVQGLVFPMMGRVGVEKVGRELADHVTTSVEVNFSQPNFLSKELVWNSFIVLCFTEHSCMSIPSFPPNFLYDDMFMLKWWRLYCSYWSAIFPR